MFWGMAFICEEYSVPAITVFCKRNNLSDDVAGAIFIGTGLSLPVMFSTFVALFVEDSSIGVGTVVGGNIFNHLINVSCGIATAPSRRMSIDSIVFARENAFYLLSNILVIWSVDSNLAHAFSHAFQRQTWNQCLSIALIPSLVLVLHYVLYGVIEVCFQTWREFFQRWLLRWKRNTLAMMTDRSPLSVRHYSSDIRSVEDLDVEMAQPSSHVTTTRRRRSVSSPSSSDNAPVEGQPAENLNSTAACNSVQVILPEENDHVVPTPSFFNALHDAGDAHADRLLAEFPMFMRSAFYATYDWGCIPSSRKWNLRYFSFNELGLFYKLEYHLPMRGPHLRFVDVFDLETIDVTNRDLLEFAITMRISRKKFFFRCTDGEIFDAVVLKLYAFLEEIKMRSDEELQALRLKSVFDMLGAEDTVDADSESIEDTMFVVPTIWWRQIWFYLTFPLKVLIFWTTPDVRHLGSEDRAIVSSMMSFAWLAATTLVLIKCLNILANLLHISGAVLGITVGAWAASYPAAWSTVVVARYGYGDMVVCNALGSNIFSNFLGLGLPWLLYNLVYGRAYDNLQDQGVTMSVSVLIVIQVLVYALVAWNKHVLEAW